MKGTDSGMINSLAFSLRALRRDWRSGELRILSIALLIAVGSVTAVGFFTDRVRQVMAQQASELLAADLVLASSDPIDVDRIKRAQVDALQTAPTLSFRSIALAGEKTQLVEVKAVGTGYPLRGMLRISAQPFVPDQPTRLIPGRGKVWVDVRLLQVLDISIGQRINLGEMTFTVTRVLTYEPDRGGDLFSIAPRLLMNITDVPATRLIQAGSRVRHKLLLAGERKNIQAFRRWLAPRLTAAERLVTLKEGRPALRAALERAESFLGLAALVSVFLAGVAIAMAARRYAQRHLDTSAIMRCLGATQGTIIKVFTWEMAVLGLGTSLIGCALGYGAHAVLAEILAGLLAATLPPPSLRPAFIGLPIGMIVVAAFALPPLLALRQVSPARVLRRDLGPMPPRSLTVYSVAIVTMTLLIAWQARDLKLIIYVIGGTLTTVAALGLVAYVLVTVLKRLRRQVGVAWRFGLANITRRAQASAAQVVAFGLGIMVLLLLTIVRSDLLEGWRRTIPQQAPNHFLINIQPDQVEALRAFLDSHNVSAPGLYPMVRARLTAINKQPVSPTMFADPHARRHAHREFNLSWASQLQTDNRVVAGRWWTPEEHGGPMISFEQGLAETLGIKIGDVLTYNIAGSEINVEVTNLRAVDWDTLNVNFFTIVPPGVLNGFPATYITSVYLPTEGKRVLAPMVKQFPNVTVLDIEALMTKVRHIMDRVSLAVEYVFIFTLLAGLAVLYAAIQATQDERRYESAVLRTLGARHQQMLSSLIAEFVALGLLAGTLAGLSASVLGYLLAEHVFHLDYHLNPWVWLLGLVGGAVGIGVAGTLGTRSALYQPPTKTLREV
ncbi:MAG: ABC transporter permease [Acidiferrobacterales bacterium]